MLTRSEAAQAGQKNAPGVRARGRSRQPGAVADRIGHATAVLPAPTVTRRKTSGAFPDYGLSVVGSPTPRMPKDRETSGLLRPSGRPRAGIYLIERAVTD